MRSPLFMNIAFGSGSATTASSAGILTTRTRMIPKHAMGVTAAIADIEFDIGHAARRQREFSLDVVTAPGLYKDVAERSGNDAGLDKAMFQAVASAATLSPAAPHATWRAADKPPERRHPAKACGGDA
jgi:hypothetical protein